MVQVTMRCVIEEARENLKKGKAAGVDGLTAQHVTFAHPIVTIHLAILFRILITYAVVPDDFGFGIVVPLVRNTCSNQFASDSYRGINLSHVLSKIFEFVLLRIFSSHLMSDTL